jgi:hypothetical protein
MSAAKADGKFFRFTSNDVKKARRLDRDSTATFVIELSLASKGRLTKLRFYVSEGPLAIV